MAASAAVAASYGGVVSRERDVAGNHVSFKWPNDFQPGDLAGNLDSKGRQVTANQPVAILTKDRGAEPSESPEPRTASFVMSADGTAERRSAPARAGSSAISSRPSFATRTRPSENAEHVSGLNR